MKTVNKIAISLLLALPHSSFASYSTSGEVQRIYINSGTVYFKPKSDSCNPGNAYYHRFSINGQHADMWYSMLLAAANTAKPVIISISNCPLTESAEIRYLYQDF